MGNDMIFKRISMQNFKSHKDTTINFKHGTTLLLGENGAGKSTILEAIHYALFKDYTGKADDIIMRNEKIMKVELEFTSHNHNYKVCRTRQGTKSTAQLYTQNSTMEYVTVADGDSVVNHTLKDMLCMDSSTFSNAIHIKQGEITSLITKTPSERKKAIGKLLKIDNLEKAYNGMKTIMAHYTNRISVLDELMQDKTELLLKLDMLDNEKTKTTEHIGLLEKKTSEDEKRIVEEKRRLKALEHDKEEHIRYSEQYNLEKANLEKVEKEKQDLIEHIFNKKKESEIMFNHMKSKLQNKSIPYNKNTEKTISLIDERITTLQKKHDQWETTIDDADAKIILLEHEITDTEKALNELIDVEGTCPICKSTITDEQKHDMMTDYEKRIIKKQNQLQDIIIKRDNAENEKGKASKEIVELEDLTNELQDNKISIDNIISESEDRAKAKEKEILKHKKKMDYLAVKMDTIKYDKANYKNIEDTINDLTSENRKDIIELSRLKNELEHINEDIINTEEAIILNDEYHNEKQNLEDYLSLMEKMRACYSKDELQKELRSRIVPLIQQHSNRFFSLFDFEYDKMMIDEDYNITIVKDNDTMTLDMMSGGEKIAIALALRLGITQSLSEGDVETMMLDEPTIHLDEYRRQELVDVLNGGSIIPQMIIVTHDNELMNMADNVITITKEEGISYAR